MSHWRIIESRTPPNRRIFAWHKQDARFGHRGLMFAFKVRPESGFAPGTRRTTFYGLGDKRSFPARDLAGSGSVAVSGSSHVRTFKISLRRHPPSRWARLAGEGAGSEGETWRHFKWGAVLWRVLIESGRGGRRLARGRRLSCLRSRCHHLTRCHTGRWLLLGFVVTSMGWWPFPFP